MKKMFFVEKKIKNLEVRSFLKKLKSHGQNQKLSTKNLEKVDHVIVSKSNFQRIPSIFFKSPVNQICVQKFSFLRKQ